MLHYVLKIMISVAAVVAVSEIARNSSFWGAVIASLPITSLLAFVWMYAETGDTKQIAQLSQGIFWLVFPSLLLFVGLPLLLRAGVGFWLALLLSSAATAAGYLGIVRMLGRWGIAL